MVRKQALVREQALVRQRALVWELAPEWPKALIHVETDSLMTMMEILRAAPMILLMQIIRVPILKCATLLFA